MKPAPLWGWPLSAALAAVLVALGDVLLGCLRAQEPVSFPSFVAALLAAAGLYSIPAMALSALQALLWGSVRTVAGPGLTLQRLRAAAADPQQDLRLGAGVLAVAASLGLQLLLVYLFARGYAVEMANKRNTALSTALFSVAVLPAAALFFFPFNLLLRPLCRLLPAPRSLFAGALLAALAVLAVGLALASVDWRVIYFGPWKALLCFLLLQALLLGFGLRAWRRANLPASLSLASGLVLLLALGGAAGFTFTRFGSDPRAVDLVLKDTSGAGALLSAARRMTDRDRDGYSPILGGGDCNDRDPTVHPGALDVPGDGIDQDCEGGDEPLPQPAAAPATPPSAESAPRWKGNWLVITIDTLRADRVRPEVAPRLAELARKGLFFPRAYAQAPNTPRSFPSFLTSRFPSKVHFVRRSLNFSPLTGKDPTLFSVLAGADYRTIGIFSHFYLEPKTGLGLKFDEWDNAGAQSLHDSNSDISAPRITARVVNRLRRLGKEADRDRPFALWTHLFDPHSTYMDHPEFPVAGKGMKYLGQRYDAEVAFTDRHVGLLLDALKEAGLAERTAVAIFSDHGEAFGEHKLGGEPLYFHGETLYDEVLRVPIVLYVPGVAPRVIDERVMLLDLAPTILSLSGVSVPAEFEGRPLLPQPARRPVYAEMLPCTSWQKDERVIIDAEGYKLYARFTDNTNELYDLNADPTEQKNLAHQQPDRVRALRRQIAAYLTSSAP